MGVHGRGRVLRRPCPGAFDHRAATGSLVRSGLPSWTRNMGPRPSAWPETTRKLSGRETLIGSPVDETT